MDASLRPPPLWLTALEARALLELGAWAAARQWLLRAPPGDGHAVLVIPGFGATDRSTWPLRHVLERLGYAVQGWELGRNTGSSPRIADALRRRLATARRRSGRPVSLIGWSLGGIYARELARRNPDAVRQVITLGSPIHGGEFTSLDRIFKRLNPSVAAVDPGASPAPSQAPTAPAGALHRHLYAWRRHRALARRPGTRRRAHAERARAGQPQRARPQPGRAVGHRRSPGAAGR